MFTYLIKAKEYTWVGDTDFVGLSTYGYYKESAAQQEVLFNTELINFTYDSIGVAFDSAFYYSANRTPIYKFVSVEPYNPPPLSATYDYDTASFTDIFDV